MFMGWKCVRAAFKPGLKRVAAGLCMLAGYAAASATAQEALPPKLRLASLDWAPYVSAGMEGAGWSSYVADVAARRFGHEAVVEYFPWTRAMQLGLRDPQYAGYFPAYYTEERARQCHFSQPIGSSTVGLAYLKSAPLHWSALDDLARLRIGVVAGFSNGPEFDAWTRDGRLRPDASPSDRLNLRKLLAGRVDAVVIDQLVLRYLLAADASLAPDSQRIAFHAKPLAELALHVCFQRSARGRALQQSFDSALQGLSLRKLEAEYFQRLEHAALQK